MSRTAVMVLSMPFVISASIEFLPAWLYWPISILCGMTWFGALVNLKDGK
jgi:hypothetical protein